MRVLPRLGRSRVRAGVGHEVDLVVRLRAPAQPEGAGRPLLCVVPVVDVSGSMKGRKLAAVRTALERLVGHLLPGDRVGLVTFSTTVARPVPPVELTEARREELLRAMRALVADGNTNLAGGLLEAIAMVREVALPPGVRPRLVLLTDGNANAGPAVGRDALVALVVREARGVTVSAFGYGGDCDHAVLGDIAREGGGSFAYIESEDAVLSAFARELGGLVATYATDVRVRIAPMDGAALVGEGAGAGFEGRHADLLYLGEVVDVARLALPASAARARAAVAKIDVEWRDGRGAVQRASMEVTVDYVEAGAEQTEDAAEVVRAVDEARLRVAQEAAERLARAGDLAGAHRKIRDVIALLRDEALLAFAQGTLLVCYQPEEYATSSSTRASTMAALGYRKQVVAQSEVARAFAIAPSAAEAAMEESFRAGARPAAAPAAAPSDPAAPPPSGGAKK